MANGFVKIDREILAELLHDADLLQIYMVMKERERYQSKPGFVNGTIVPKGCCLIGLHELARVTSKSVQNVRTLTSRLEKMQIIFKKSTNKGTLIFFDNSTFNKFMQSEINKQSTNDQQTTNKRPTNDQQLTNKERRKERKKELLQTIGKEEKAEIEEIKNECFIKLKGVNDETIRNQQSTYRI